MRFFTLLVRCSLLTGLFFLSKPMLSQSSWSHLMTGADIPYGLAPEESLFDRANQRIYYRNTDDQKLGYLDLVSLTSVEIPSSGWFGRMDEMVLDTTSQTLYGWRAGKSTVYSIPVNGGTWTQASSSSSDGAHYGAASYWSPVSNGVGFVGGYGYFSMKNAVHEIPNMSGGWVEQSPNTSTGNPPRANFWLTGDQYGGHVYLYGREGNINGQQYQFPLDIQLGNNYNWPRGLWKLNLANHEFETILSLDDPDVLQFSDICYDWIENRVFVSGGTLLQSDDTNVNQGVTTNATQVLDLSNPSGFTEFPVDATYPPESGSLFFDGVNNRLIHYGSSGLWELPLSTPAGPGCTDPAACNYNASATEDDGSCTYAAYGRDCDGNCGGGTRWFVDATADAATATGDTLTPFATIQAALDMACPSDTVLIAPGTYVENVSSTVDNLTIRGYAPSMPIDEVAANVIIDGNELGTALFISGQNTTVNDLSITNGFSSFGAGLYMSGAHSSVVERCQIRNNQAAGDITGHGLALLSNNCLIENCSITENHGTKHTVDSRGSNNTITNCRITNNIATAEGGGVVVYTHEMLIQNCVISDNQGGGLTTYRDDTVIDHCTISGNTNWGIFIWGFSDDAAIFISNSIISNPSPEFKMTQTGNIVTTANIRNTIVEEGVDYDWISVYKVFDVDGTLNTLDPVLLSDYTLASTSSAIGTAGGNRYDFAGNLGTPSSALDLNYTGRPQPSGTDADLGAFEHPLGTPEPTFGCTDDTACNYNPAATDDDASCIAPTCNDPTACNYDANATCGGGTCIPSGCMEEDACNYDPAAQCAGEACDYTCCPGPGCCDDPSQWDSALQQCNTAAPDTIVVTDTLLVPTPFCGAGTHWDPVTEMCIADVPGTTDENCTVMNLQELAEGYQVLLDHTADQDSIILALQDSLTSCADGPAAANSQACAGEDHVTFDGYDYSVVGIGDQCWFAENLRTTTYLNGDAIPEVTDNAQWGSLSTGARCEHPAPEINTALSGLLYNWWVVNDSRGVCPSGWHVPSHDEWKQLEAAIGMSQAEIDGLSADRGTSAPKIKSAIHWDGTDEFGFNAVPAGQRSGNADGAFDTSDNVSAFWTSTPSTGAWYRSLRDNQPAILAWNDGDGGDFGMSIRCVKD